MCGGGGGQGLFPSSVGTSTRRFMYTCYSLHTCMICPPTANFGYVPQYVRYLVGNGGLGVVCNSSMKGLSSMAKVMQKSHDCSFAWLQFCL